MPALHLPPLPPLHYYFMRVPFSTTYHRHCPFWSTIPSLLYGLLLPLPLPAVPTTTAFYHHHTGFTYYRSLPVPQTGGFWDVRFAVLPFAAFSLHTIFPRSFLPLLSGLKPATCTVCLPAVLPYHYYLVSCSPFLHAPHRSFAPLPPSGFRLIPHTTYRMVSAGTSPPPPAYHRFLSATTIHLPRRRTLHSFVAFWTVLPDIPPACLLRTPRFLHACHTTCCWTVSPPPLLTPPHTPRSAPDFLPLPVNVLWFLPTTTHTTLLRNLPCVLLPPPAAARCTRSTHRLYLLLPMPAALRFFTFGLHTGSCVHCALPASLPNTRGSPAPRATCTLLYLPLLHRARVHRHYHHLRALPGCLRLCRRRFLAYA